MVFLKILGLRMDLATTPRRTIRENEWMQFIPLIVAMLKESIAPEDHTFLAERCESREGEVTFLKANCFALNKEFMKMRDILEAINLFRRQDIEDGKFR